jgi:hypothetical protein
MITSHATKKFTKLAYVNKLLLAAKTETYNKKFTELAYVNKL